MRGERVWVAHKTVWRWSGGEARASSVRNCTVMMSHLPEVSPHDHDVAAPRESASGDFTEHVLDDLVAAAMSHGRLVPENDVRHAESADRPLSLSTAQTLSSRRLIGTLKVEWAVRPRGRRVEATPLETTASAIPPLPRA